MRWSLFIRAGVFYFFFILLLSSPGRLFPASPPGHFGRSAGVEAKRGGVMIVPKDNKASEKKVPFERWKYARPFFFFLVFHWNDGSYFLDPFRVYLRIYSLGAS